MRRTLGLLGLALLGLALLLIVRAAGFESRQLEVEPVPPVEVDAQAVARRLAGGLRFPTISYHDRSRMDGEPFLALHAYLRRTYPRVHETLRRETLNGWSLLYTWEGSDPGLAPVVLMAHSDVVPVDAGSEGDWSHPPFGGEIADGQVWGRGAIDDKGNLFCILEAVERLLDEGWRPRRTVLLAFGHDEEVGGDDGALAIAARLEAEGVRPFMVLDEGGAIVSEILPGIRDPLAIVTIAEKGSISVELLVDGDGGHSSVPPRHTAIGVLAAAIERLERNPMPASIDGTTRTMIDYIGPELDFPFRIVLANLWLFGAPLRALASRDPVFDAMVRTTTAVTIVEGGTKSNVLPTRARAVVNHRIHPNDDIDAVLEHVRRTVDDDRVRIEVGRQGVPRNPSPVSRLDSDAFALLQRTLGEIFPGALVVPNLGLGGTDARHFYPISDAIYRLSPYRLDRDALEVIHGTDERIPVDALPDAVRFFERVIRNSTSGPEEA